MIRILLIRHGSTDLLGRVLYGRLPGVHLNAEGVRQSESLAEHLARSVELSAVVSSPLERARETAEPIACAQGKPLSIEMGLTEIDFGEWVGKSFPELNGLREWKEYNRHRSLSRPPGGESMLEVQHRAWRSLDKIARERDHSGAVAVITHGDVIRGLLLLMLGMAIDRIHRLEIAPASVSEIYIGEHDPLIRHVNQIFY